ncbi:hypothetical protein [Demequina sp. NBRC 110056]|uniref:hypothetical protein n=1 Tax=Demequina sp. NBRC 110056 TaxID=1570345 RepID=UPI0009FD6449|nr:hypothetical protein [Demequina sp. NBRC 110056]
MRRSRGVWSGVDWRSDEGRFPVGALLAVLVVAAVGYGAYWFLGENGFLGEPEAEASQDVEAAGQDEEDPRPEWLQDTDHQVPAIVVPEDDRMPQSRNLEPWVWDEVDEDWGLTVIRVGEGDQYTWFSDVQELYLVSPSEDLFKVAEFDTTINRDVVHWDPELLTSWIKRSDGAAYEQVIEFDLRDQKNTYDFAASALSTANRVENGIANLDVVGVQPDDYELWVSFDANGDATGVLWRDGEEWIGSLVDSEIGRQVRQGFSEDRGMPAWIDASTGRAVYHGQYVDPDLGTVTEHVWLVHDLLTDTVTEAVVDVPGANCNPLGGGHGGEFDGDRIVAVCGGTEYLLDPYAGGAAVER